MNSSYEQDMLIRQWTTEEEKQEFLNIFKETCYIIDKISPYLYKLPEMSFTRLIEAVLTDERASELKKLLPKDDSEFGAVDPDFENKLKELKYMIELIEEGAFDL